MRAFVCDPVCAQTFGHNAVALNLFRQELSKHYADVTALCARYLPDALARKHGFVQFYDFYYQDYIPLPNFVRPSAGRDGGVFSDHLEYIATQDARQMLARFSIGAEDVIVFPSVDYYGAIGLFNALATLPPEQTPRLLIRFIGVMETASRFYRDPLAELVVRIRMARERGLRMGFSAETPKLAEWMSDLLEDDVSTTPYPDVHDALAMPMLGPFQFYCPGSAREDKGFFSLLEIMKAVRLADREMNIRFTTQSLRPSDAMPQQTYVSRLYAVPGVQMLPSAISDEEMLHQFRHCNAVLLPYDRGVYEKRGSAAMMEAVCFGRPIITLAGTAFAEQVSWYRLGMVVDHVADMPAAVFEMACQPRDTLARNALRGRKKFLADVASAYSDWFKSTP